MNGKDWLVVVLLAAGVLGCVCTSLGLLLFHDVYQQIHFLAPASLIGATAIPAAVVVHEGFSQAGDQFMARTENSIIIGQARDLPDPQPERGQEFTFVSTS